MGGKNSGNRAAIPPPTPKGNRRAAKPGRELRGISLSFPKADAEMIREYLALEWGREPTDQECKEWIVGQAKLSINRVLKLVQNSPFKLLDSY